MNADELYNAWAPPSSPWSRWVKPVIFAKMGEAPNLLEPPPEESAGVLTWTQGILAVGPADGQTAVIVDLPSDESVLTGMALAEAGYQPVPLYNSVPASGMSDRVAVDMRGICEGIKTSARRLQTLRIDKEAPPAFLLDSRRRSAKPLLPGDYDNRSMSLPTDFPSANLLLAHGIQRIAIIMEDGKVVQTDLAHTLRRWQQAGLKLFLCSIIGQCTPITIARPPYFRHLWYGFLATLNLRRSPLGGFGGFLPMPSTG